MEQEFPNISYSKDPRTVNETKILQEAAMSVYKVTLYSLNLE